MIRNSILKIYHWFAADTNKFSIYSCFSQHNYTQQLQLLIVQLLPYSLETTTDKKNIAGQNPQEPNRKLSFDGAGSDKKSHKRLQKHNVWLFVFVWFCTTCPGDVCGKSDVQDYHCSNSYVPIPICVVSVYISYNAGCVNRMHYQSISIR